MNLVTEKGTEGRVFVSTYPTMMGLIDTSHEGQRRFGVGHFDLVIIDEAHRSVFQKYRAIFEYFDSLLVGLTATPKDEVDRKTYGLFELEKGVPTDAYPLEDAVGDKFLVPPKAVSVPLKFQLEGITYDKLSQDEKDQWDALEWDEEEGAPDRVEAEAVNKWFFNKDTVDKVLEHLLREHQGHLTIHKVRMNEPLTASDLAELERMLAESGVGGADDLRRATEEAHGLGLFVRSLVGLDREAAKRALTSFVSGTTLRANQIEFVNLLVNHLTEHGVMEPEVLYESPFTDVAPQGPDGLFNPTQVGELISLLDRIKATAVAA